MKLYKHLSLSNENFADIIINSPPGAYYLDRAPHATREELLAAAKLAYQNDKILKIGSKGAVDISLPDWTLLTCGYSNWNDYFGIALWCPSRQHALIAHRGTVVTWSFGAFIADLRAVYNNSTSSLLKSTHQRVAKVLRDINSEEGNLARQLSITGHSLGGFLASVTTFTCKYLESDMEKGELVRATVDHGLHPHTVTFDSPGSGKMMRELRNKFDDRCRHSMLTKSLDITTYVLEENIVNAVNDHIGTVILIKYDDDIKSGSSSTLNIKSHSLKNFKFENIYEEHTVRNWPSGIIEKTCSREIFKRTVKYEPNIIDQRIFSLQEIHFLEIWTNLKDSNVSLDVLDFSFLNLEEAISINELLGNFKMAERSVRCVTVEKLQMLIRRTKQLVRWYYDDIMEVLKEAMGQLPAALYRFLSNVYLESVVTMSLVCEDTLGLKEFLDSDHPVLGLEVEDHAFQAGRLRNLLQSMGKIGTFITWKNLIEDLDVNVDIANLHNNEHFTEDNILVIDCASLTDKFHVTTFKRAINKMRANMNKKILFLYSKKSIIPKLLSACYNIAPIIKIIGDIELKDLTNKSIEELMKREVIVLGDGRLSLQKLSESMDTDVLQQVIGRELENLLLDDYHLITIESSLSDPTELDEQFSILNEEVAEADIMRLLEKGSLVVVSGDTAPWAERGVILAEGDGASVLRQECLQNPGKAGYWLEASGDYLCLKEIYHDHLLLKRRFYNKMKVDIEKLIQEENTDKFVIEIIDDDEMNLANVLKLSEKSKELLNRNLSCNVVRELAHFQMGSIQESVHRLRVEKTESGERHLVWQSSSGSLENLRPFITPDISQAISERELIQSERRLIILTGEPGIGKTTFLKNISLYAKPEQWIIRVSCISFQEEIDKLPIVMDLESAVMFLTVRSRAGDTVERRLLQHFLQPASLSPVLLLIDGFDEIRSYGTGAPGRRFIDLIKFLLDNTSARIIITTRIITKHILENTLLEFATVFQHVQNEDQIQYLETFWSTYLQVSLSEFGDLEKERLRQQARWLYEGSDGLPRRDVSRFLGIPQQMKMLARIYLKPIIQFFNTSYTKMHTIKIESTMELYKAFVNSKIQIYFNHKTGSAIKEYDQNDIVNTKIKQHRLLALNIFVPQFTKKYFKEIYCVSGEMMTELNRYGIIHLQGDGTYQFVHHTYAEYFMADLLIQWLRQDDSAYEHIPLEELFLSKILLISDYQIVRMFLDEYYNTNAFSENAQRAITGKLTGALVKEGMEKFRDKNYQTALHIAVTENRKGIAGLLLNCQRDNTSQHPSYITFIAARDMESRTALMLANETKKQHIVKTMLQFVDNCNLDSKRKILLGTFLRCKRDSQVDQMFLTDIYKSSHLSKETKSVCERVIKILETELDSFIISIRNYSQDEIIQKYNQIEDPNERYYMPLAANDILNVAFFIAAELGYIDLLKLFFNDEVLTLSVGQGWSALHYTIFYGFSIFKTVEYLVNKKVDVNSTGRHGVTPLLLAVNTGDVIVVEYLLNHGANPNIVSFMNAWPDVETSLLLAVTKGFEKIVIILLSKGADPNLGKSSRDRPLLAAVRRGFNTIVKHLLKNGANPNFMNSKGETSISIAKRKGYKTITDDLIAHGAAEDNKTSNRDNKFSYINKKGVDIKNSKVNNEMLLLAAAYDGSVELIKKLIEMGTDVNCCDTEGLTPLLIASQNGHKDVIEFLDEKGADFNYSNSEGNTALLLAASDGHTNVVKYLIKKGLNINTVNSIGFSPLLIASLNGHKEVVQLLSEKGADYNYRTLDGSSPLLFAASNGHTDLAQYILKNDADIDYTNFDNISSLIFSSKRGYLDLVMYLVENGTDVNCKDYEQFTPLLYSAQCGNVEIVKYLLEKGADVGAANMEGRTALMVAAVRGNAGVVTVLLEYKADRGTRDDAGKTALEYAREGGHKDVVNVLKNELDF